MYTNNHLQYLLTNYHDDLDFSLNSCGIDVLNKIGTPKSLTRTHTKVRES